MAMCPCGKHPREETGASIGPFWQDDKPQQILVCPNGKAVMYASEGFLYVHPGGDLAYYQIAYAYAYDPRLGCCEG